jgi:PAS domain-containing protein
MPPTLSSASDPDQTTRHLAALQHQLDQARAASAPEPENLLAALETAHEELRVAEEELRSQQESIARLVDSHRSLRVQQERTMAILPVPVVVTDMRGVIRSVNAAAAHLAERRVAHMLGKPLFTLFSADDRPSLRRLVAAGAQPTDGPVVRRTATLVPRHGDAVLVELTGSLQLPGAADGEIAWVVLTAGSQADTPTRITDTLAALALLAHGETDPSGVLVSAASICATALDAHVSISLGSPVEPDAVATSSTLAQLCDGVQVAAGEGPSVDALRSALPVRSASVRSDDRWPRLADRLPEEIGSVVATPIESADRVLGTLTAYAQADDGPTDEVLGLLAVTLGGVLHELELHRELARLEADMQRALASRSVIDQAKGIVMAKRGIDADAAWDHLVELSSTRHQKVRDVAQQIVSGAPDRP